MVELEKVKISYQDTILDNISLSIQKGECVLITGVSGSGKSSLIHCINGLISSYYLANVHGSIKIDHKDITNLKLYEISMLVSSVFQNPKTHFFNINTTLELIFYLENIGLSKQEIDQRLNDMLEMFPIKHLLNRNIFELSGGEKQILSIASAYIAHTKVIVLDEPSSSLDEKSIQILKQMLIKLKKKGITLILSEHRLYYLMDIIDRVYLLKDHHIFHTYTRNEFCQLLTYDCQLLGLRTLIQEKLEIEYIHNTSSPYMMIKHLEYPLSHHHKNVAFNHIGFEKGKIYGIIGSNGNGKSTLINSLIGLNKKSKEDIYFKGKRVSKKERLKISSLVMQDVNHQLFTNSVYNEVILNVKNVDSNKIKNILEKLDLYKFKDCHPMSLSGGQKQRVAIASVFCQKKPLLFFDEPTSGMDYYHMVKISEVIKENVSQENIIFIASHDTEFINRTCDFILKID